MKTYALPRIDGGVAIMQTDRDPMAEIAKWPPARKAEITGEVREIQKEDIPADRSNRGAWKLNGTKIET